MQVLPNDVQSNDDDPQTYQMSNFKPNQDLPLNLTSACVGNTEYLLGQTVHINIY